MDERAAQLAKTLVHYGLVANMDDASKVAQQILGHRPAEKLPTIDELDSVDKEPQQSAMENKALIELMQEDAEEIYAKKEEEDG